MPGAPDEDEARGLDEIMAIAERLGLLDVWCVANRRRGDIETARHRAREDEWRRQGRLYPPHSPAEIEVVDESASRKVTAEAQAEFAGKVERVEVVQWAGDAHTHYAVRLFVFGKQEPFWGYAGSIETARDGAFDRCRRALNPKMRAVQWPGLSFLPPNEARERELIDAIGFHSTVDTERAKAARPWRDRLTRLRREVVRMAKALEGRPAVALPEFAWDSGAKLTALLPHVIAFVEDHMQLFAPSVYVPQRGRGRPKDVLAAQIAAVQGLRRTDGQLAFEQVAREPKQRGTPGASEDPRREQARTRDRLKKRRQRASRGD